MLHICVRRFNVMDDAPKFLELNNGRSANPRHENERGGLTQIYTSHGHVAARRRPGRWYIDRDPAPYGGGRRPSAGSARGLPVSGVWANIFIGCMLFFIILWRIRANLFYIGEGAHHHSPAGQATRINQLDVTRKKFFIRRVRSQFLIYH